MLCPEQLSAKRLYATARPCVAADLIPSQRVESRAGINHPDPSAVIDSSTPHRTFVSFRTFYRYTSQFARSHTVATNSCVLWSRNSRTMNRYEEGDVRCCHVNVF